MCHHVSEKSFLMVLKKPVEKKKISFFFLDQAIARTSVAVFGKAVSEASCTIMYLYTSELYPTVVRSVGQQCSDRPPSFYSSGLL